jgi:hypothetical protein
MEAARPLIFDILRGVADRALPLRPDFVACAAPGSLFIFAVNSDREAAVGALIEGQSVTLRTTEPSARVTVVVAGVHRDFAGQEWDLRHVDDGQRRRSHEFWQQEWRLG